MRGTFDAVASSFFLDATNDIVGSVRAIANALRQDGGVWVSFGPLKYHFDDSVHLSSDELRAMVEAFGFTVLFAQHLLVRADSSLSNLGHGLPEGSQKGARKLLWTSR